MAPADRVVNGRSRFDINDYRALKQRSAMLAYPPPSMEVLDTTDAGPWNTVALMSSTLGRPIEAVMPSPGGSLHGSNLPGTGELLATIAIPGCNMAYATLAQGRATDP